MGQPQHRTAFATGIPEDMPASVDGANTAFSRGSKLQRLWHAAKPSTKSAVAITPVTLLLAAVVYGVLFFAIGTPFLPGNSAFCTLLIWICAVVLAHIAYWVRIPRVMGMLGAGLLLANVPNSPIAAFVPKWGVQMRAAALATIFLRCGLELEFKTMRLYKWPALRLAFIPGMCEAFFDGGLAVALFNMPVLLAFSLGFILKAVGPGLVVPAMFQLQKQRLGADKGIPSTVVISASFDDIIAITGFSIFISLAITGQSNVGWNIASGPAQVVFGIVGGILVGAVLGCTKLFKSRQHRLIGTYGSSLLIMFFLEYFNMLSGGALGALTVGLAACYFWESGTPRPLSLGPNASYSADIERVVAKVWDWVWEPLLFGTIGASIKFAALPPSVVPRSAIIVVCGLALRTIITFVTMSGNGYNVKEQLFYAIAWTPKATVQASLSAYPLTLVQTLMDPSQPDYAQWVQWGQECLTTGVFAIIICATLGTLAVQITAPLLLHKEEAPSGSRRGSRDLTAIMELPGPAGERSRRHSFQKQLSLSGAQSVDDLKHLNNQELLLDYFDAIDGLIEAVRATSTPGKAPSTERARLDQLCDRMLQLQQEVDSQLGSREMTVRQMLAATAEAASSGTLLPGTQRHSQLMAALQDLSSQDRPISSAQVAHTIASIVIDDPAVARRSLELTPSLNGGSPKSPGPAY